MPRESFMTKALRALVRSGLRVGQTLNVEARPDEPEGLNGQLRKALDSACFCGPS